MATIAFSNEKPLPRKLVENWKVNFLPSIDISENMEKKLWEASLHIVS